MGMTKIEDFAGGSGLTDEEKREAMRAALIGVSGYIRAMGYLLPDILQRDMELEPNGGLIISSVTTTDGVLFQLTAPMSAALLVEYDCMDAHRNIHAD